jgi:O-antigen ligase
MATDKAQPQIQEYAPERGLIFAAVAGFFFLIALLKFGNPVILDSEVTPPKDFFELLYQLWPVKWAYISVVPVVVIGLLCMRIEPIAAYKRLVWLLLPPAIWLVWQFIAATHTVDAQLTNATLKHFVVCIIMFYLGFFVLGRVKNPWPLWLFLSIALLWIVRVGFEQHFGGLDQTRQYFYSLPNWRDASPEFIKKLSSNRIYSTLFYPNTLAGALLLLTPVTLGFLWQVAAKLRDRARCLVVALVAAPCLACLFWSGSKAGWLITLVLILIWLLRSPFSQRAKYTAVAALLVIGLVGFAVRNAQFFRRGSTSVVARFDYWRAAWSIGREHPVFGTGPGTFAIGYAKIKSPGAEMARLVHNDYIEQFCDSGGLGFAAFFALIAINLTLLYRYLAQICWFAGLGVVAVLLHESVEFHLYIPAIAWPTLFLLGWLTRRAVFEKSAVS